MKGTVGGVVVERVTGRAAVYTFTLWAPTAAVSGTSPGGSLIGLF